MPETRFRDVSEAIAALPAYIRIGALDWNLVAMSRAESDASSRWGYTCPITFTIAVANRSPSVRKLVETMLHEITHAVLMSFHEHDEDGVKPEAVACVMGTGLAMVFRDNKWLADWIKACADADPE